MSRLLVISIGLFSFVAFCFAQEEVAGSNSAHPKQRTYGNAQVQRVIELNDGFTFTCDIADWPAIIGQDVTVRIDGVTPPKIVLDSGQPNNYYNKQLKDFLATVLSSASTKNIVLNRIKRADTFALIADVTIDGKSLAKMLIDQGLAQAAQVTSVSIQYSRSVPEKEEVKTPASSGLAQVSVEEVYYVASKSSKVFHKSTCRFAKSMTEDKKVIFKTRQEAEASGRRPCKSCNP